MCCRKMLQWLQGGSNSDADTHTSNRISTVRPAGRPVGAPMSLEKAWPWVELEVEVAMPGSWSPSPGAGEGDQRTRWVREACTGCDGAVGMVQVVWWYRWCGGAGGAMIQVGWRRRGGGRVGVIVRVMQGSALSEGHAGRCIVGMFCTEVHYRTGTQGSTL